MYWWLQHSSAVWRKQPTLAAATCKQYLMKHGRVYAAGQKGQQCVCRYQYAGSPRRFMVQTQLLPA